MSRTPSASTMSSEPSSRLINETPSPGRFELFLIGLITLVALVARSWHLDRLAIEHFDEGVYASNLLLPDSGWKYPARHLYAPPLLPALIEWSQILTNSAAWAPFLPGILLGTLTVPALWLLTRTWAGAAAGLAAAGLLALNDYHIALSRSALTDAPLACFLVLAVWCQIRMFATGSLSQAVFAGVFTAFAWATKYNGWLPLAIAASGGLAGFVVVRRGGPGPAGAGNSPIADPGCGDDAGPSPARLAGCFLLMTAVAALLWFPVWQGLQSEGGYAAVAANHANYLTGLSGWKDSLLRHAENQKHFGHPLSICGLMLGLVSAVILTRSTWNENVRRGDEAGIGTRADQGTRSTWNDAEALRNVLITTVAASLLFLFPKLWGLLLAVIAGILLLLFLHPNGPRVFLTGTALVAAWCFGLLLAAPMYRPYPRLLLPLLPPVFSLLPPFILFIRFGGSDREGHSSVNGPREKVVTIVTAGLGALLIVGGAFMTPGEWWVQPAYESRTGLAEAAVSVLQTADESSRERPSSNPQARFVLYVYGEPGLFYHLPQPDIGVQPVMDLAFAKPGADLGGVPTYLVAGPHAERSPQFQGQLDQVRERLQLVAEVPYRQSDFVLLDEVPPSDLEASRNAVIRLYRVTAN